ncbi:hydroxyacid dehydrogenase [Amycolatopsis echigonensis]|uniref:Hydroxyacid dehydrogenase n=1 Tax=Amycolatopsis echigonensis TaxID=2576905 RepID=A0A8E1W5U9_9PSEU|nr:hydroxyacid dehydrogenase [Amycolatopsis echigonensis]MBB2504893.1 hydroxyacid dehydrogenase [Amycolatopsis echigonensis]
MPAVIVALGPVDDLVAERLRPFGEVVIAESDADQRALLPDAVGLIARATSTVDQALLDSAPNLRVIGRTGIGVDRVDLDAASARSVPVVVTPSAGTRAVAEGALTLALHLLKRIGRYTTLVREGRWTQRNAFTANDLDGAVVGLVGYGRIGRRVAELARAFGASVLVYDPYLRPADADGVTVADLPRVLTGSDVLSLHAPLTPETRHLLGEAELSQVKPGAILVNCARGGLLDLDAVHAALLDGRLGGVGLDVYDPEPPVDHPLFHHPDVALTPHIMGISARAWHRTCADMATGMAAVLGGGRADHVANPEVYREVPA